MAKSSKHRKHNFVLTSGSMWLTQQSRSQVQVSAGYHCMRSNLGQVIYTYVPLSPSSITYYNILAELLASIHGLAV